MSSQTPWKSSGVPIVEPMIVSSRHQIRFSAAGGFGPEVAPQTTILPSRAAEASERFQVASPTCSIDDVARRRR